MRVDGAAAATAEARSQTEPRAAVGNTGTPELRLDAWEGPLDLLLELARARHVDLARLSILDVAGQCGAALEAAAARGRTPLARLAEWLVMAAHLALLRSRLLLPVDGVAGADAGRAGEALQRRLADREHASRLADWLEWRPQLGRDVFARGTAESANGGAVPTADAAALFRACLAVLEKGAGCGTYRPEPLLLWRVPDALARLRRLLPAAPREGAALESFLPEVVDQDSDSQMRRRSALASTLLAGLELEREGIAVLDQDGAFGPVRVAPARNAHAVRPSIGVSFEARG